MGAQPAPWAEEAVRQGGGGVVAVDDVPDGLVWIEFRAAQNLKRYLDAHPGIGWVQLSLAGVEDLFAAGVIDHGCQWTSAKGAGGITVALFALLEPFRVKVTVVRQRPEPLLKGHPLWSMKNCLITPHTADTKEMIWPLLAKRITENVRRLGAGEEFIGLIDAQQGY